MLGLTIDKILVIMVIAMFILGPERLPVYARKLGELVRNLRRMANGAKDRLRDEMGPEFEEVDWKQLDPRQYDPRRIIREALVEDEREARLAARRARQEEAAEARRARAATAEQADGEADGSNSDSVAAEGSPAARSTPTAGDTPSDDTRGDSGAAGALRFDSEAT